VSDVNNWFEDKTGWRKELGLKMISTTPSELQGLTTAAQNVAFSGLGTRPNTPRPIKNEDQQPGRYSEKTARQLYFDEQAKIDRTGRGRVRLQTDSGRIVADLHSGVMGFDISANRNFDDITGRGLFDLALSYFGGRVKTIRGNWYHGGGPDNLNEVNRLTGQGVPLSEAVKRTWTEKQAKRHGYTEAIISEKETRGKPGEYTHIVVNFHKKEEK
jgi:hypothetical protein